MSESHLRILHVTRNLPPLVGGMERLNWHLADELSRWASVRVVGPQVAVVTQPEHAPVTGVPLTPLWKFLVTATWASLRVARAWRPHVVLAGSGLTAPLVLFAARLCGAKAAAYVHGLDLAATHPIYRALWRPAIRRLDVVIANSTPTAALARSMGVDEDKIRIVHPGVVLPAQTQTLADKEAFLQQHGLKDRTILLSVGRLTSRKALREFVQNCLPAIVRQHPQALLVVVGDAPSHALHAQSQTPASIQAAADAVGVGEHIRFLGVITEPKQLALVYETATVHVFPVRSLPGDPEGFGMVAIEAAAHGTPTVAYATGGVVDAVSHGRSGRLVASGDAKGFAQAVLDVLTHPLESKNIRGFAADFEWRRFGERIRAALGLRDSPSLPPEQTAADARPSP